jgi:acyl carrier protein
MESPTPPAPKPSLALDAGARATLLQHFGPEVGRAYESLCASGNSADADKVVLAVVRDHMPDKARRNTIRFDDHLALGADLGFDSIAMTEMVFFFEDLLQLSISNAEIMQVRTIGDLRAFVRHKLADRAPGPPAANA